MFGIVKELIPKILLLILFFLPNLVNAKNIYNCDPKKYSELILSILIPDYIWADKLLPRSFCVNGINYQTAFFKEKPGEYQKFVRDALNGFSSIYDIVILDSYALHEFSNKKLKLQKFSDLNTRYLIPQTLIQAKINSSIYALPIAINMPLQVSSTDTKTTNTWEELIIQLKKEKSVKKDISTLAFPMIKGHSSIQTLRGLSSGFTGQLGTAEGKPDYLSLIPSFKSLYTLYNLSWPETKSSTGKDALHALKAGKVRRAWAVQSDIYTVLHYNKEISNWNYSSLPYKVTKDKTKHSLSAYDVWLLTLPLTSRLKTIYSKDIINSILNHSSQISKFMLPAIIKDKSELSELATLALDSLKNNAKAPALVPNYRRVLRIVLGVHMEILIDEKENFVNLLRKSQDIALSLIKP